MIILITDINDNTNKHRTIIKRCLRAPLDSGIYFERTFFSPAGSIIKLSF